MTIIGKSIIISGFSLRKYLTSNLSFFLYGTGDRLTNAVVRAGLNDDVITNHQCGSAVTADQAQPLGGTIEFACESPLRARYTSVDIPTGGYLQLCEVTVFELPLESCLPPASRSQNRSLMIERCFG